MKTSMALQIEMIGNRIRSRRKELGLTQPEVGSRIGVSKATVSLWENDETMPNGENLQALSRALDRSPEWILFGKDLSISEPSPQYVTEKKVPLIDKSKIDDYLSGALRQVSDAGPDSALIVSAFSGGERTFAYIEQSDGMLPRICAGDMVYIDPDQTECKPGVSIYMMNVDGGFILGSIKETPRGIVLHFDNRSTGWEPMPISKKDCVGLVIAFTPSWLIK